MSPLVLVLLLLVILSGVGGFGGFLVGGMLTLVQVLFALLVIWLIVAVFNGLSNRTPTL